MEVKASDLFKEGPKITKNHFKLLNTKIFSFNRPRLYEDLFMPPAACLGT